ncbi:AfsR/SARP family transcriptional regulator [Kribbella sp. NPDC020789]
MADGLEFRILGPLEIFRAGRPVAVPAAKQRVVLAALLLRANQVVGVEELIDRLWQADMPPNARGTAQAYVMRLRRVLGEASRSTGVIRTETAGYRLTVRPEQLDVLRFHEALRNAEEAGRRQDPVTESAQLEAALALWRGRPLADVPSDPLRSDELPRLEELRFQALERRLQLDLDLGRHSQVIPELRALTSEYPFREGFWGQLMLALYRANRPLDALDTYERLTAVLSTELGSVPSRDIHRLQLAIQNDDPALRPLGSVSRARTPRSLPADVLDFVGREDEIAGLNHLLTRRPGSHALRLVVISGPPGVGKTALAVHVAHQFADDFPDGQLYVDLRGYAAGPPAPLGRTLTQLLRTLGTQPAQLPANPDEQLDLYQSLLANRRLLVVLDNAASAEQVRQLLPAEPGCAVLVTSRNELRGLIALQGARRIALEPLSEADARALLTEIAGVDMLATDPAAGAELLGLCGRLPLAVRIAAANLFSRRSPSLADYVNDLRDANRLSALSIEGDDQAAVRTAFSLSYEPLEHDAARLFRLLGLVPGPDFSVEAAAALAALDPAATFGLLDRLTAASLVQQHNPGRYQLHDLLRLYARERAQAEETEAERTAALTRLYSFYLSAADAAADRLDATLPRLARPAWLSAGPPMDHEAAVEWLARERAGLVAAVETAASDDELAPLSWCLADALAGYLHTNRHDHDLLTTATIALASARRYGERRAEATMLNALGVLHWSAAEYGAAASRLQQALALFQDVGDAVGTAVAMINLGVVDLERGRTCAAVQTLTDALAISPAPTAAIASVRLGTALLEAGRLAAAKVQLEAALTTSQRLGLLHTEATALNTLGAVHLRLGEFAQAAQRHQGALDRYQRLGSRHDQAEVLQNLAALQRDSRQFGAAIGYASDALELAQQTRNRRFEVDSLNTLATAHSGLNEHAQAVDVHTAALSLARNIGYPQGEIAALIGLSRCQHKGAAATARAAAELARTSGLRLREAQALTALAEAELRAGRHDAAAAAAEQARVLQEEIRAPLPPERRTDSQLPQEGLAGRQNDGLRTTGVGRDSADG